MRSDEGSETEDPASGASNSAASAFAAAMAEHLASLPLVAALGDNSASQAAPLAVTPPAGAITLCGITIWGVDGDTVTASDFEVENDTLTVKTSKHFAVQTPDQTLVSEKALASHTEDDWQRHANPVASKIVIPAGQTANITLAGIGLKHDDALDLEPGAVCNLILADGTYNSFYTPGNMSAIHNPTGATLTIDDEVANKDSNGNLITPENGLIPRDMTLADGRTIKKGDPLSTLDSNNPGALLALVTGSGNSSPLGGHDYQAGGNVTINGGSIAAYNGAPGSGGTNCAAGIGGGGVGAGTGPDEWITINGGRVDANVYKTDYGHGAGIGGGNAAYTGNIRINGGYTISTGGSHGSGFGAGCGVPNCAGYQIIITGGTLIPSSVEHPYSGCGDIGAPGVDITITGGSVGNGRPGKPFNFVGSAHNEKGEVLRMVEVDLTGDVGSDTFQLTEWSLKVGNATYPYGAPAEFDKGHLYLWLPEKVVKENEITVDFTYRDTVNVDEDGNPVLVTPEPLFRPKGDSYDNKVRRYVSFELPSSYTDGLTKYYDGTPFDTYDLGKSPIVTAERPPKTLNDTSSVEYVYQRYDKKDGVPLEPEVAANPDGTPLKKLSTDSGVMRFTLTSMQYSKSTDPAYAAFKESYWGHRATGWYEIKPVPSQVRLTSVKWTEDGQPGSAEHDARKELLVTAEIDRGPTQPDGQPTKGTCAAPEGTFQLYVDGAPVGPEVPLRFQDETDPETGATLPANAERVDNGEGGSFTRVKFAFVPADADFLVPDATGNNEHTVSLQYRAAKNYLDSANPETDEGAPEEIVTIEPVDPGFKLYDASGSGYDPKDEGTSFDPTGRAPIAEGGVIEKSLGDFVLGDADRDWFPLFPETDSSGAIDYRVPEGNGVVAIDPDGTVHVTGVGRVKVTVEQKPNGAYVGAGPLSFWVVVKPDPKIAPEASVSKAVENLTHPEGPTQPGDRLRYTVTASNAAAGSAWNDVVVTDALPACLELDGATVQLDNPSDGIEGLALAGAASVRPGDVGKFALASPGADGRPVLSVPVGTVYGGSAATVTFECTVAADAVGAGKAPAALANVAEAEGTRADPDDPEHGDPLPVEPDLSDPVTPPGGDKVAPSDPDIKVSKSVENATSPGAKVTKIGDTLRYTIVLANAGAANSCLVGAVVSDPLPAGIEPVAGTIRMALADGTDVAVPDSAYDAGSRTVAVTAGDLWGGQRVTLTFDATVGEAALGTDAANVAFAHGTVPSEEPGDGSQPQNPEPGKPAPVPPADDDPVASSDPAVPPVVVGDDPEEGDLSISKEAENLTRQDGTTRVGDTVRYTIVLRNEGPATSWMDAAIRDDVPEGLEPIAGSIKMALPDGTELEVSDDAYDHRTRVLAVAAGSLHGGQAVTLAFDALVTEAALGSDIGNTALAYGQPPSKWDPDGKHPEPGTPFVPGEGWEEYGRTREVIESPAAYPPGVTRDGGVLPAEGPVDDSSTIAKTRLAQTGDALGRLAGTLAGAAAGSLLVAGALALSTRRRARSAR